MTGSNLYDHLGRPLALGTELGKGGEGSVYNVVNSPDLVAKVYHKHKQPPEAKLRAMIGLARKELCDIAAWPTTTLHERPGGPVCGLAMRKIKDFKEIHFLYSPAHRKVTFPQADWQFLVHTSMNCAAAFDTLHSSGVVIGDVNQSNVFVSAQGLVILIDCDSYQVQLNGQCFPCEVGIDLFTPPELQGRSFRGIIRTPNHDRFGLAVLIFYLMFMNRHPFAGRYMGHGEMPINQAIAQHRFAFSRSARNYQMQTPLHAPPLSILSPQLVDMFELAFGAGSVQANGRPTAAQWVSALKTFLGTLRKCSSDPGHVYAPHLSNCPWCGLMQQGAPNFFVTVAYARSGSTSGGIVFVLSAVWARIEQVSRPNSVYVRPPLPQTTNPNPWPANLGRTLPTKPVAPVSPTSPPVWPGPVSLPLIPPQPVLPKILSSPPEWPGPVGLPPLPPKPTPPQILVSPPAAPLFSVGRPKLQRQVLQKDSIQRVVGISAAVCCVIFVLLIACTVVFQFFGLGGTATLLGILAIGPFLATISLGLWWMILEAMRQQKEKELNNEYEEELAQLKAEAKRKREHWKKQLAAQQAEARRQLELEVARWKEIVSDIQAKTQQQRIRWEQHVAAQQVEPRQKYNEEVKRWQSAVARIEAETQRQRELWEKQLAGQQAEARRRYGEELVRWQNIVSAIQNEVQRRRHAVSETRQRAGAAEQNWTTTASRFANEFDKKKGELEKIRDRYKELIFKFSAEQQRLQANARQLQLDQFLQQKFINDNKIPKIGPGLTQTLASYGIETAFDVVESEVMKVPGFKQERTRRLVEWRRSVELQFIYNAAAGIPPHEQQALESKYTPARQQLEATLLSGERELKAISADATSQLKLLYEHIKASLNQLLQADADITVIPPGL